MKYQAILPILLVGCSTVSQEEQLGVVLRCQTQKDECPAQSDVAFVVESYAAVAEAFSARETLWVNWLDADAVLRIEQLPDGQTLKVKAQTDGPNEITVTGCRYIPHELKHAEYMRNTGDGDHNHEGPGGPWTQEDNDMVREVANSACP